jgi:hypothetical protein
MHKNGPADNDNAKGCPKALPLLLFFGVLMITLVFGLWPFRFFPCNNAKVSLDSRCIELSGWAMAVPPDIHGDKGYCTFSGYVVPSRAGIKDYAGYILSLYNKTDGRNWLFIGQWRSDLVVRLLRRNDLSGRLSYVEKGIDGIFTQKKPFLLRMVYDSTGITVAAGTTAVFNKKGWHGPEHAAWICGVSPFGTEPWPGSICMVPGTGRWNVPPRFHPPFRRVLDPIWHEDLLSTGYLKDATVNFFGFLPFGFFFVLLFENVNRKKGRNILFAVFFASLACTLFIELMQTTIPFRTSQMSDVVLNTIGGFAGGAAGIAWKNRRLRKDT